MTGIGLRVLFGVALLATAAAAQEPRLVPKPSDAAPERRVRPQPSVPEKAREIPFEETAPEPVLTASERERGFLLFQRPITDPVYPNTRPLPHERLGELVAFAAPGEAEPVTFALYPARPLQNLRVRVSALKSPAGEIPSDRIDVRLAAYWNVGYPSYTTTGTYRRMPELLERATFHSSPAGECQRWWLKIRAPEDAKAGLYRGTVTVWDDGFDRAVEIPLALRVLGFRLQKDPRKRHSTYFYVRNRTLYKGRDEAFIRKAADNDYRAMVEYGMDMFPTLYLRCEDGKRITIPDAGEIDRMRAAGMEGPAPVTADSVIARLYRDLVPGGKRENHWKIDPMPPPAFYARVTELFREFERERKEKGWPEIVCCPVDEVDATCREFGAKVYAAIKAAGIRTYATKDPAAADAKLYESHIDVWCSQPYSIPCERILAQNRHEYWCYPNHNAGEIKDRVTMGKGGRMTYGFGFWRSGFTTLIPWHWSWTPEPDAFDYLRGKHSGCGQRVDDEGEVIPAFYWECFREGGDDARYLYTLQQAVVEREGSPDPECAAAAREGRRVLEETWGAIRVQTKYLSTGMWPSEEFQAVRWLLATHIERLLRYPAARKVQAPSILPELLKLKPAAGPASALEEAAKAGTLEALDLGGDFSGWKNGTAEGRTEVGAAARREKRDGLRWTVEVDHLKDGGEGGKYPVGWPRLSRSFGPGELDLTSYDSLLFWIRVDSNRDEVADDRTPVGISVASHARGNLFSRTVDLGDAQRSWIPVRLSVREMLEAAGAGAEPWKSVSRVQIHLSEQNYAHGARLVFDFGEVALQRLKAPAIAGTDAPRYVLLPQAFLPLPVEVMGMAPVKPGSHGLSAWVEDASGKTGTKATRDLAGPRFVAVALAPEPGVYTLRLEILDAGGRVCSSWARPLTVLAGPLSR
jgi:hypothetical protein